jgi:predicted amidohydrolase YtcJ
VTSFHARQLCLAGILLLPAPLLHAQSIAPDTIYMHGKILTGAHLGASDPSTGPSEVTAIAILSGRIIAIGSDAEMQKLKAPQTRVIDLQGAFAMPGFNDAHTHIASAGQQKLSADLQGSPSLADMQSRVKAYAATAKPGAWLRGGGWDHTLWPDKKLPTRADLDAVTSGHPAIFYRVDGHIVVANTAALAAADITASTPVPEGSKIDVNGSGKLTGIVREAPAIALIEKRIPPPTSDERRHALQLSIADALAHGVTSVQDLSEYEDFLVLEEMEHRGTLKLRVSEWLDFNLPLPVLQQRRASHAPDDPLLHLGMLKGFMDGSLGSRTATMEDPYSDDSSNSGIPRYDEDKLNKLATERASAGFQLGFHAIGDRANEIALNALAAAEQVALPASHAAPPNQPDATIVTSAAKDFTSADLRLRIEHAQVVEAGDFDQFAKLGIIASMQPSHLLTDMAWAAARLGPERVQYSYAWRSFLDHGVTLAFGTDYPVESINPFRGLYAAVTRQNEAGTQSYQPQQKISVQEALYAYTQASAFAEFEEKQLGQLEPGYLADIVVLDRNPLTASPQQLLHTRVLRTIVNGETVYVAPDAAISSEHKR